MGGFGAGGDGVFVHAVEETLDHAKGDEAAHVDAREGGGVGDAEALDALALLEVGVELDQVDPAEGRGHGGGGGGGGVSRGGGGEKATTAATVVIGIRWQGDVAGAFGLHFFVFDQVGQLGGRGVDGGEAEDVEEEDAVVVEQVRDGFAHEFVVGVGEEGDLAHAVDAVDVRQDEQHGEIPVLVGERREPDGAEGHVVRVQGRRGRVHGEEFDVERVVGVNGDHGFAVVVEVFEQDFAQGVDFARVGRRRVAREEAGLLFERAEERGQLEGDGEVRGEVHACVEDQAEVEEEFVARVRG